MRGGLGGAGNDAFARADDKHAASEDIPEADLPGFRLEVRRFFCWSRRVT